MASCLGTGRGRQGTITLNNPEDPLDLAVLISRRGRSPPTKEGANSKSDGEEYGSDIRLGTEQRRIKRKLRGHA